MQAQTIQGFDKGRLSPYVKDFLDYLARRSDVRQRSLSARLARSGFVVTLDPSIVEALRAAFVNSIWPTLMLSFGPPETPKTLLTWFCWR